MNYKLSDILTIDYLRGLYMKRCNSAVNVKNINLVKVKVPALIIKSGIKSGPETKYGSGT